MRQTQIFIVITSAGGVNYIFPKLNMILPKTNVRYRILQTINELPDTVTSKVYTHSIIGVTNYAKQYLIVAYKIWCTIGNCYIIMPTHYHNQLKPSPKDVLVCTYIIHVGPLYNVFVLLTNWLTYLLRSVSDRSSWRLCACAG